MQSQQPQSSARKEDKNFQSPVANKKFDAQHDSTAAAYENPFDVSNDPYVAPYYGRALIPKRRGLYQQKLFNIPNYWQNHDLYNFDQPGLALDEWKNVMPKTNYHMGRVKISNSDRETLPSSNNLQAWFAKRWQNLGGQNNLTLKSRKDQIWQNLKKKSTSNAPYRRLKKLADKYGIKVSKITQSRKQFVNFLNTIVTKDPTQTQFIKDFEWDDQNNRIIYVPKNAALAQLYPNGMYQHKVPTVQQITSLSAKLNKSAIDPRAIPETLAPYLFPMLLGARQLGYNPLLTQDSKNSAALYIGAEVDPITGSIRLPAKPKMKQFSNVDRRSVQEYKILKSMYNWNSSMKALQSLRNTLLMSKQQWGSHSRNVIKNWNPKIRFDNQLKQLNDKLMTGQSIYGIQPKEPSYRALYAVFNLQDATPEMLHDAALKFMDIAKKVNQDQLNLHPDRVGASMKYSYAQKWQKAPLKGAEDSIQQAFKVRNPSQFTQQERNYIDSIKGAVQDDLQDVYNARITSNLSRDYKQLNKQFRNLSSIKDVEQVLGHMKDYERIRQVHTIKNPQLQKQLDQIKRNPNSRLNKTAGGDLTDQTYGIVQNDYGTFMDYKTGSKLMKGLKKDLERKARDTQNPNNSVINKITDRNYMRTARLGEHTLKQITQKPSLLQKFIVGKKKRKRNAQDMVNQKQLQQQLQKQFNQMLQDGSFLVPDSFIQYQNQRKLRRKKNRAQRQRQNSQVNKMASRFKIPETGNLDQQKVVDYINKKNPKTMHQFQQLGEELQFQMKPLWQKYLDYFKYDPQMQLKYFPFLVFLQRANIGPSKQGNSIQKFKKYLKNFNSSVQYELVNRLLNQLAEISQNNNNWVLYKNVNNNLRDLYPDLPEAKINNKEKILLYNRMLRKFPAVKRQLIYDYVTYLVEKPENQPQMDILEFQQRYKGQNIPKMKTFEQSTYGGGGKNLKDQSIYQGQNSVTGDAKSFFNVITDSKKSEGPKTRQSKKKQKERQKEQKQRLNQIDEKLRKQQQQQQQTKRNIQDYNDIQ